MDSSIPDRTRAALERAAAVQERRRQEDERNATTSPRAIEATTDGKPAVTSPRSGSRPTHPVPPVPPKAAGTGTVAGKFSVGEEVLAKWKEDDLYYKAVIDSVTDAGGAEERYCVTFTEYGNSQPGTLLAWVVAMPLELASSRQKTESEASGESDDGENDEELLALEQQPSTVIAATPEEEKEAQGKRIVGRHPDGSPVYMSVKEEARLRALKKQDAQERSARRRDKVKQALGKLTLKKRSASPPPPLSVIEVTEWKKVTPLHAPSPAAATVEVEDDPQSASGGRKLSPRRAPPAPPSGSKLVSSQEELEPLPAIVQPASLSDFTLVGHVFVALCDLRRLHCDAWIVPTGLDYVPASYWFLKPSAVNPRHYAGTGASGLRFFGKDSRVRRAPGWPESDRPIPYLVAVDRQSGAAELSEWLLTPVKQCLEVATQELAGTPPLRGRLKHLIALPVIGTGAAGLPNSKGDVIAALLPALIEHARVRNVDICLTTNEPALWSAVQSARARLTEQFAVPGKLLSKADELARFARAGKLALFVGAGVSIGAGLPSWGGLLGQLMDAAGMTADEKTMMNELSLLDQANILQRRMGSEAFTRAVAGKLHANSYSISHALLASLNVDSVVSTNYDTLFEDASRDAGKPCAVLPYEPSRDTQRFVLKLHGDVNHAQDIVLTREDYLRYGSTKAALAAIVSALLITKHFLFVGFSLTDDNFLKIVDQVRQAMGSKQSTGPAPSSGKSIHATKKFGSATFLFENHLFDELWADIDIIAMTGTGTKDFPKAGNLLEIWLDFLAFRACANNSFLLEPHFDGILSAEDVAFKKALASWMDSFPAEARKSPSFTLLKNAVRENFGGLRLE